MGKDSGSGELTKPFPTISSHQSFSLLLKPFPAMGKDSGCGLAAGDYTAKNSHVDGDGGGTVWSCREPYWVHTQRVKAAPSTLLTPNSRLGPPDALAKSRKLAWAFRAWALFLLRLFWTSAVGVPPMDCSIGQVCTGESYAHKQTAMKVTVPVSIGGLQVIALVNSGCGQILIHRGLTPMSDPTFGVTQCIHGDMKPYSSDHILLMLNGVTSL